MSSFENETVFATISTDLATVTGGYDLGHAIQAGNAAAGPSREAGQTLGAGFDAGYKIATGRNSTIGSTVGGPLGAAVGWTGGFATDTWRQLHAPAPTTR
jgi:hypothetical protein